MSFTDLRPDRALLGLLVACTLAALVGYASFGLHPGLLGSDVGAARTYAAAIVGFPRVLIVLGFLALVASFWSAASWYRWTSSFAALYAVSLGSELLGTSVGLPFGAYRYTDALGPKWFGLVPLLIPVSWCTMTLASFIIARRLLAARRNLTSLAAGAALLIAWDLALDPAMSRLTPYWVWGVAGSYFGMPWLNLAGWGITGVVLQTLLFVLRAEEWVDELPRPVVRATVVIYAANLLLPVGMTIAAGIPGAALVALGTIYLTVAVTRWTFTSDRRVVETRRTGLIR